ncbi:MAG: DMT family transporter [Kiritimatiellae bacterium]|nr:DMT family transporter [Kiritimatiellia bacterium]
MDRRTLKGILCLVASAFGFALMGMFVRLTDNYGTAVSAFQKSFFRNAVALFIAGGLFFQHRHQPISYGVGSLTRRATVLVLRAVFGTAGIFANFYALGKIDLGDAMMLNKLAPFFTVLFSWLFIKERITLRQALCLGGALVGAALVAKPGFGARPMLPVLCGLSSGVCAGAAYACVRELGLLKMDGRFIVLFFSGFSCLASAPFLLFAYQPMTAAQFLILGGAGAGAAIGQFGITAAYRFAEPRRIAVFDYTNILFSALLGFLVFGQVPDIFSWCGFALIITMAFLMRRA